MCNCSYWWTADGEEWCDLTGSACACRGHGLDCRLGGIAVAAALREQEKETLAEIALRASKRREKEAG